MKQMQRGKYIDRLRKAILAECVLVVLLTALLFWSSDADFDELSTSSQVLMVENDYIKWVDFTVSYDALCKAYEWDVETHGTDHEISWVELLAYTAAKTGGSFDKAALKIMENAAKEVSEGKETFEGLTKELKYYSYYLEAYDAAIGGLVGEYERETEGGEGTYETVYGLKGYFPLARGFDYTHYDDFGAGRSYGYQRKHLGHDMMGLVGTPIRMKYRICIS